MNKDDGKRDKNEPIKVILLGDSGVGKTNIILRYIKGEFNINSITTIGTTFAVKELRRNNTIYNLNVWDTTGQEAYRAVTKLFIQGAKIIILVYSIVKKDSFESLDYWYNAIKELCEEDIILAIVGNKIDLFDQNDNDDQVQEEEGQKYAEEKKAIFKLTSAKIDKKGIDSLFDLLLDKYIEKIESKSDNRKINNIVINSKKSEKKIRKINVVNLINFL